MANERKIDSFGDLDALNAEPPFELGAFELEGNPSQELLPESLDSVKQASENEPPENVN